MSIVVVTIVIERLTIERFPDKYLTLRVQNIPEVGILNKLLLLLSGIINTVIWECSIFRFFLRKLSMLPQHAVHMLYTDKLSFT